MLISSCAFFTDNSFDIYDADFTKSNDRDLCGVYGYRTYRAEEARNELVSRHIFSDTTWQHIEERDVVPGMTECAVRAAFALEFRKILSSSYQDGSKGKSFIYSCIDGRAPLCPYTQIDMENGVVVAVFELKKI